MHEPHGIQSIVQYAKIKYVFFSFIEKKYRVIQNKTKVEVLKKESEEFGARTVAVGRMNDKSIHHSLQIMDQ